MELADSDGAESGAEEGVKVEEERDDDAEMCGICQERRERERGGGGGRRTGTALSGSSCFSSYEGRKDGTADIFATFQMGALTNYGGDLPPFLATRRCRLL